LVLPVEGDLEGQWGNVVNESLTSLVDSAVAGSANVSMTDANYTLTVINGIADESRQMFINLSGTLTATRNVICPAVSKLYFVYNSTSQSIVFKTSAGSGITVATMGRMALYCNGVDVVPAFDDLPAGTQIAGADITTISGTQTLTNKTISADDNTLSGIAASSFVLSNASGNLDGSAAQKVIPAGVVVGTTDTQALTNKTLSIDSNTVSGVAASSFVLSNASGNLDGSAAQKVIPAGVVVGTTDTQALTNKTISADSNTLSGIAASSFVLSNASGNIDGSVAQKVIPAGVVVGTTDTQTLTNKVYQASKEVRSVIPASAIDLSLGNYYTKTISATTTFTVSNVPATGTASAFVLELTNGGSATVNWWAGVKWAYGTAPVLTLSGVDVLAFYTFDEGTTWRAFLLAKDSK